MLQKPKVSSGLIGHLARMQTETSLNTIAEIASEKLRILMTVFISSLPQIHKSLLARMWSRMGAFISLSASSVHIPSLSEFVRFRCHHVSELRSTCQQIIKKNVYRCESYRSIFVYSYFSSKIRSYTTITLEAVGCWTRWVLIRYNNNMANAISLLLQTFGNKVLFFTLNFRRIFN